MPLLAAEFWSITLRSIYVSGVAVCLSSLVGIPCGVWLGMNQQQPWARVAQTIIRTGMALPPVVVGLLLYLLLSRSGPLGALGWLFSPGAMILAQAVLCFPFVAGITMSAAGNLPAGLVSQVRSLGASPWQLRWAIVREARRGVVLAVVAAMGRSISEVGAVLMVGGNIQGHTRVLTTAIVVETSKGEFEFALLLGGALLLLALLLNAAILLLQGGRP